MIQKSIIDKFYNAVLTSSNSFDTTALLRFKTDFPNEYKIINGMYHKRIKINRAVEFMQFVNGDVYWITLTFKNSKDKNLVSSKRKEAMRFLNGIFKYWLIVEEYGEDKNRYHIHGFATFKEGFGFNDFRKWHSRQKIILLNQFNTKRRVKYCTDYAVKEMPRLRSSKMLVQGLKVYKRYRSMINNGFKASATEWLFQDIRKIENDITIKEVFGI